MMEYKGYVGKAEYDPDADILHGEILGLRDVITFQGKTTAEIKQALKDSVDEYLEFCRELGREPEKPYSGNFTTRVDPELHRRAAALAESAGTSLNAWVGEQLRKAVDEAAIHRIKATGDGQARTAKNAKNEGHAPARGAKTARGRRAGKRAAPRA